MFTKVCGLKTVSQIETAVSLGYSAVGVVLHPKSKRYCSPDVARELAAHARGRAATFVVGMTFDEVKEAADAFDYIQIYEDRSLPNLAYASQTPPPPGLEYQYFFYDASAGSGEFRDFPPWLSRITGRLVVAGGLTPENVGAVVRDLNPYGVDVSSGVERNGAKDPDLMNSFLEAVRGCR